MCCMIGINAFAHLFREPSMSSLTLNRRQLFLGAAGATGAVALNASSPSSAWAAGRITLGAWTKGMDAKPVLLGRLSTQLGQPLGIASVFRGPGDVWPGPEDAKLALGRTLLVSWHLDDQSYGYWASDAARPYLVVVARQVKAYGKPVAIRPWAEMNGDWMPRQPTSSPTDGYPTGYLAFVAAWRAVVNIFRAEGVTNVRWVFNPTTDTYAETTDVRLIWPGRDYVDVLGLDGYNWGTGGIYVWRSFEDVYATQYARLTALAPDLPLWVCEIGCADPLSSLNTVTAPSGQSKASWWRDMAATAGTMSTLRAVVLFDIAKERDWRAASSRPALTGLKAALVSLREL